MARFRALGAFVIADQQYVAGTAFADTVGNALAGDVVWAIDSNNYSPMLAPLDAGAAAIKASSIYASTSLPCTITGANSIDG